MVHDIAYNYHDSLHARLIEGMQYYNDQSQQTKHHNPDEPIRNKPNTRERRQGREDASGNAKPPLVDLYGPISYWLNKERKVFF